MADMADTVRRAILELLGRNRAAGVDPGTQSALARKMGVSPQYLTTFLKTDKSITLDTLERIAQALGVAPAALLTPPGQQTANTDDSLDRVPSIGEVLRVLRWIQKEPEGAAFLTDLLKDGPPASVRKLREG